MNKILTLFVFFIFNYVGFSQLIITEIADPNGSGNHNARYIELYNSSGSAIDLSGYKIILYANAKSLFFPTQSLLLSI